MDGFFHTSTILGTRKSDHNSLAKCESCKLYKSCNTPKMPVAGSGKRRIMIVSDTPSKADDATGRVMSGMSGDFMRAALEENEIDMVEDCWLTYATICHQKGEPSSREIEWCRPNVLRVIHELRPAVIILLGRTAVESVIGWAWKESIGTLEAWLGWQIPCQEPNAWLCPTYHPVDVMDRTKSGSTLEKHLFMRHISEAVQKTAQPWDKLPEYEKRVEVVSNADEAADKIREITKARDVTAADYETNALKHGYDGAKILCCSLSTPGTKGAISFMWNRQTRLAMSDFWFDKRVPKVFSNAKFELGWTYKEYGKWIRNVYLDTMLAAHFLDCRPGITSIKFLVFRYYGVGSYNDHIEPLLRANAGKKLNAADMEIEPRQLCQYCGEDSLYEKLVGKKQIKELKLR